MDEQTGMFGEENLHAMWVADMDFRVPQCVIAALENYVQFGVYGIIKFHRSTTQHLINWEKVHHELEVKKEWMRFSPGVVAGFTGLFRYFPFGRCCNCKYSCILSISKCCKEQ